MANKRDFAKLVGARIRERREALGLEQWELAKRCGWSQSRISNYERGKRLPIREAIRTLARALEWEPSDMFSEEAVEPGGQIRRVPIKHWTGEMKIPKEVVATVEPVSDTAFALRVVGDAMEAQHGRPTYPDGSIVICDPEVSAKSGRRVIVRLPGQQLLVFRELSEEAGKRYLRPLNRQYPVIELPAKAEIIGVVVQTILPES
jgi:SOS-response transcriptional repressor LexA